MNENERLIGEECHLLKLSDDLLLELSLLLPITDRVRLLSLHSRLHAVIKRSWHYIQLFSSREDGYNQSLEESYTCMTILVLSLTVRI